MRFKYLPLILPALTLPVAAQETAQAIQQEIELIRNYSNFDLKFFEGNMFIAEVDTSVEHIDNFEFSPDDKESTIAYSLNPKAFVQVHQDNHLFQSFIDIKRNQFADFSDDDHNEYHVLGKYFYRLGGEHRLLASFTFDESYEYRGSGLSKGLADVVDTGNTIQETLVNVGYQRGRPGGVSHINLLLGANKLEYQTNAEITDRFNFDTVFAIGDFDYLYTGKTYFTSTFTYYDFTYDNASDLERTELGFMVGAKWEASLASKFEALVGYQEIELTESKLKLDQTKWRFIYTWEPSEQIRLSISSKRQTENNSEVASDFAIADLHLLLFNYEFTEFTAFDFITKIETTDVQFNGTSREEEELAITTRFSYWWHPRVTFNVSYGYEENDSDFEAFSYEQNRFSVGATFRF
ncbi:outer membrane beta-barrel protein [Thalassotalea euphylliae]|uniref:outer membrane beta-barrel protein n=1 Tax=Thalassotalea euphylliae TaxID=1655234 RepID=UPI003636D1B0